MSATIDGFIPETESVAKPFVKWAGGKGQLLKDIRANYPDGLGNTIRRYAEPFVGGGAVLFDILNNYKLDEVYISDINSELINTYTVFRDHPEELIAILKEFQDDHLKRDDVGRKECFSIKRSRFNELKRTGYVGQEIEMAALFVYLNKTCFNGLYRVNAKGEYNVPAGVYKNPMICDESNILAVSEKLSNVQIVNADYRESLSFIDQNTFVYFDPPYRPLTTTASFTAYTKELFNDNNQRDLAEYVKQLTDLGAKVMVSNSDPKNADENDDFFDDLYDGNQILRITANRMINSNAEKRGKINELLITNFV